MMIEVQTVTLEFPPSHTASSPSYPSSSSPSSSTLPRRELSLQELLHTERNYLASLEQLQSHRTGLLDGNFLTHTTAEFIFPDLDALVHFQSRFLLELEVHAGLPLAEQCFGSLFTRRGVAGWTRIYEPWVVNWERACEKIDADLGGGREVQNEDGEGRSVDVDILKAGVMRPVSRLCRYPLLLKELLHYTPAQHTAVRDDLNGGLAVLADLLTHLLTQTRAAALSHALATLLARVEHWKGHDTTLFGDLLLHGKAHIQPDEHGKHAEREYETFLFERVLLAVRESRRRGARQPRSPQQQRTEDRALLPAQINPTPWKLKGRIFLPSIHHLTAPEQDTTILLKWRNDGGMMTGTQMRFAEKAARDMWFERLRQQAVRVGRQEDVDGRAQLPEDVMDTFGAADAGGSGAVRGGRETVGEAGGERSEPVRDREEVRRPAVQGAQAGPSSEIGETWSPDWVERGRHGGIPPLPEEVDWDIREEEPARNRRERVRPEDFPPPLEEFAENFPRNSAVRHGGELDGGLNWPLRFVHEDTSRSPRAEVLEHHEGDWPLRTRLSRNISTATLDGERSMNWPISASSASPDGVLVEGDEQEEGDILIGWPLRDSNSSTQSVEGSQWTWI